MRIDQADNLRKLISLQTKELGGAKKHGRLTVLSGCKGGVGVTTLALNLAVALRHQTPRVLMIDCNPLRGDLASIYGLRGHHDIDDVLQGRCSAKDATLFGPIGTQIIPKFGMREPSTARCWQLLKCLDSIAENYDHIIVDAGCCLMQAEVLFPAADHRLLVTTLDQVALTDSYAFIKTLHVRQKSAGISLVTNRVQVASRALHAEQRIIDSCLRFLDLDVKRQGRVPFDETWEKAVTEGRSVHCVDATSPASQALTELTATLTSQDLEPIRLNSVSVG